MCGSVGLRFIRETQFSRLFPERVVIANEFSGAESNEDLYLAAAGATILRSESDRVYLITSIIAWIR